MTTLKMSLFFLSNIFFISRKTTLKSVFTQTTKLLRRTISSRISILLKWCSSSEFSVESISEFTNTKSFMFIFT